MGLIKTNETLNAFPELATRIGGSGQRRHVVERITTLIK